MSIHKQRLATLFGRTGLSRLGFGLQVAALSPFIRVVNYHDVPPELAGAFEEQLRFYARHFTPVGWDELVRFRAGGWSSRRPGLIVSFDDGLRSHAEVVAPLLERHGFPGWFLVPTGLLSLPAAEQHPTAVEARVLAPEPPPTDGRVFMTWDQVRELDSQHVIGAHTVSHHRLSASTETGRLRREIFGSKADLEEQLGRDVPVFCWVGGEEDSYSAEAAALITEAGFEVGFMTNNAPLRRSTHMLQVQRTNVEAWDSLALVRFQLSGAMDLLYAPKRRRVVRLTR